MGNLPRVATTVVFNFTASSASIPEVDPILVELDVKMYRQWCCCL